MILNFIYSIFLLLVRLCMWWLVQKGSYHLVLQVASKHWTSLAESKDRELQTVGVLKLQLNLVGWCQQLNTFHFPIILYSDMPLYDIPILRCVTMWYTLQIMLEIVMQQEGKTFVSLTNDLMLLDYIILYCINLNMLLQYVVLYGFVNKCLCRLSMNAPCVMCLEYIVFVSSKIQQFHRVFSQGDQKMNQSWVLEIK